MDKEFGFIIRRFWWVFPEKSAIVALPVTVNTSNVGLSVVYIIWLSTDETGLLL